MNLSHHEVQKDTRKRRHYRLLLLGMFGILTAIVFFSFWIGYYPLSPSQNSLRPVYRRISVRCRLCLSGNVPQSPGFSRYSGRLLWRQSGSRFCYFMRISRLAHPIGCLFGRYCSCCGILSDQPKIHVFPYADPGSYRLYDHVSLQRRSDHDQIYCRSQ